MNFVIQYWFCRQNVYCQIFPPAFMVEILCPHCEGEIELDDDASGEFECPLCEGEFEWNIPAVSKKAKSSTSSLNFASDGQPSNSVFRLWFHDSYVGYFNYVTICNLLHRIIEVYVALKTEF